MKNSSCQNLKGRLVKTDFILFQKKNFIHCKIIKIKSTLDNFNKFIAAFG